MFKSLDMRVIVILALNLCYLIILGAVNSEVAPYVRIMLPSIFIVAPALFLGWGWAAFIVLLSAFLMSAFLPVRFGILAALWLASAFAVRHIRFRFRALDTFSLVSLQLFLNVLLVFIYACALAGDFVEWKAYILRVSWDMAFSSLVVALSGRFFSMLPVYICSLINVNCQISEN